METLKVGDKIQCLIIDQIVEGVIIGFGTHKGRPVIDLDCNRFVYYSQILSKS